MNHPQRRETDQLVRPMFYVGVLLLLIAAALTVVFALMKIAFTWPVVIVVLVFGGGGLLLMPTERIIRGVQIWRRNGRSSDGNAQPPG